MAKSPPPIVYIGLVIGLGAGGYYLHRSGQLPQVPSISLPNFGNRDPQVTTTSPPARSPQRASDPPVSRQPASQTQISLSQGERVFFENPANPNKAAAADLIELGRLDTAIPLLELAVQTDRNDPESLIYLNNVRASEQGDPLVMAVVVPGSTNPDRAKETLRGVAYRQEQFRGAGGLGGRLLQVLIVDDGDDPERARQVAEYLVGQPQVLAVLGHNASGATLAAGEIYQSGGLPMISSTSTSTAISTLGNNIFRVVPSDQIAGTQLARYALGSLQTPRAAVFYNPNSAYSTSLRTAFATTISTEGGVIVADVDLSIANFDAPAALRQAISQGAEVLFMAPDNATAPQARQLMQANNNPGLPMLGGDVLFSFTTLQEGSLAQGLIVAIPWHPQNPAVQTYAQAAERQWGGQVSWRTALADDATATLLAALGSNPSRNGIRSALGNGSFLLNNGASGDVRFLPSGDRDAPNILVQVQPGSRSGTGFDFVPLPR